MKSPSNKPVPEAAGVLPANSDRPLNGWWSWGCLLLAGALTAGGPLLLRLGLEEQPRTAHGLTQASVGLLLIGLGIALGVLNQIVQKSHAKKNEERRAAGTTRLNDSLASMHRALGDLITSDQTKSDAEAFFSRFVSIAPRLMPFEGARVCIYRYDKSDDPEDDDTADGQSGEPRSGPREQLERIAYDGRGDEPREFFHDDTRHGRQLIGVAKEKSPLVVNDFRHSNNKVDRPDGRTWVSFIAVPLKYSRYPKGVITIDSREPQTFTLEDLAIGWSIANIAALGMSLTVSGSTNTGPETNELFNALNKFSDGTKQ